MHGISQLSKWLVLKRLSVAGSGRPMISYWTMTNAGSVDDLEGAAGILAVDTPWGGLHYVDGCQPKPPGWPPYEPYVPRGPLTYQGVGVTVGPPMPIADIWMGDTHTGLISGTLVPGDDST